MSADKPRRYERTSLACLALLFAVNQLLLVINHDAHVSMLATTSFCVVTTSVLALTCFLRDKRSES